MICAWCKKEIAGAYEYTPEKEPLCSDECANKCHFGFKRGLFSVKVSTLTKEQRRSISAKYNETAGFVGAMRSVEKQTLGKNYKRVQYGLNSVLFIGLLLVIGLLGDWMYAGNLYFIAFLSIFVGYVVLMDKCMKKIEWFLKFRQLHNESR